MDGDTTSHSSDTPPLCTDFRFFAFGNALPVPHPSADAEAVQVVKYTVKYSENSASEGDGTFCAFTAFAVGISAGGLPQFLRKPHILPYILQNEEPYTVQEDRKASCV